LVEVETAITNGDDLNAYILMTPQDSYTLLHLASLNNHLDALQRLLMTRDVLVEQATVTLGWTAFHIAARHGRVSVATMLLEFGANAYQRADDGLTPLFIASAGESDELVALLTRSGADQSPCRWMSMSPEDIRASIGSETMTKHLSRKSDDAGMVVDAAGGARQCATEMSSAMDELHGESVGGVVGGVGVDGGGRSSSSCCSSPRSSDEAGSLALTDSSFGL
jgi:hypothetical protein